MTVTINTLLDEVSRHASVIENWRLDAELIMAHVLDCNRAALRSRPERIVDRIQQEKFAQLINRRLTGEPVAYLLQSKAFWDFQLHVDARVLVPRPETELLVERALACLEGDEAQPIRIADLGTGSGAIAIALARHSRHWQVIATDISVDALNVARCNVQSLQVDNIDFCHSSWCQALADDSIDLLVSNPPYVAQADPHLQADGLPFEPALALVAANDGLAAFDAIATGGKTCLKNGAWLLLEHGYQQASAVSAIVQANGYTELSCWQDLAGLDRVTVARNSR